MIELRAVELTPYLPQEAPTKPKLGFFAPEIMLNEVYSWVGHPNCEFVRETTRVKEKDSSVRTVTLAARRGKDQLLKPQLIIQAIERSQRTPQICAAFTHPCVPTQEEGQFRFFRIFWGCENRSIDERDPNSLRLSRIDVSALRNEDFIQGHEERISDYDISNTHLEVYTQNPAKFPTHSFAVSKAGRLISNISTYDLGENLEGDSIFFGNCDGKFCIQPFEILLPQKLTYTPEFSDSLYH